MLQVNCTDKGWGEQKISYLTRLRHAAGNWPQVGSVARYGLIGEE